MKAFLFYAPGDIRYGETARPKAGPGEVLVEIKAALTCGTDLKTYRRGHPVLIKETPSVFGHEWAGIVAELGAGVEGFELGERVVAPNSAPCGRCYYCQRERPSLCEDLQLLNGAYAEYISVPARIVQKNLLHIPENVTFRQAPVIEPLACALHGLERCNVQLGDTVCIIGHGPIGLMLTRLAKLKGARVIVVGRNPFKLKKAQQFGADEVVDITTVTDPVDAVRGLTPEGRGADVAIEAVGSPETWEQAIDVTRPGGLVNLFGGCKSGTRFSVDTRRPHYDELAIIGVFHHTPRHVRTALSLVASGQIDADALIPHEMPLERLKEAFQLMISGETLKVAIIP
jgi:L-iditol 2-dehydrogenase